MSEAGYCSRVQRSRRGMLGYLGAVAAGATVAACGSSNNKSATHNTAVTATQVAARSPVAAGASPAPRAAVASTPAANPSLKTGGTIQYAFVVANPPLDPYEPSTYAAQLVFNTGTDPNVALSHKPIGDLVTGYEVTPDGLTYTMRLQPNAMFHPPLNRPLNSADVMASWRASPPTSRTSTPASTRRSWTRSARQMRARWCSS